MSEQTIFRYKPPFFSRIRSYKVTTKIIVSIFFIALVLSGSYLLLNQTNTSLTSLAKGHNVKHHNSTARRVNKIEKRQTNRVRLQTMRQEVRQAKQIVRQNVRNSDLSWNTYPDSNTNANCDWHDCNQAVDTNYCDWNDCNYDANLSDNCDWYCQNPDWNTPTICDWNCGTNSNHRYDNRSMQTFYISQAEKDRINAWINRNSLNHYGDPRGTVYTGGTPLFNEATGQYKDRYDYICRQHPDRPWN